MASPATPSRGTAFLEKQSLIQPTPSHATFCLGGGAGAKKSPFFGELKLCVSYIAGWFICGLLMAAAQACLPKPRQVRTGLTAGGRWIRTIGTRKIFWLPRRSPQFTFRNVSTGSLATTNPAIWLQTGGPWARQMPPRSRAISACATSGEISQA